MNEEVSIGKINLDSETIKSLIKKAAEEGQWEANYLLKIHTYFYSGGMGKEITDYRILHGEVEEIELTRKYDNRKNDAEWREVILIPKEVPIVIEYNEFSNIPGHEVDTKKLYIFTKHGWKSIEIN